METEWFRQLDKRLERIEQSLIKAEQTMSNRNNSVPSRMIDNRELAQLWKVSLRTLQRYRDKGLIPYIIVGGKCLYEWKAVENTMREGRINAGITLDEFPKDN